MVLLGSTACVPEKYLRVGPVPHGTYSLYHMSRDVYVAMRFLQHPVQQPTRATGFSKVQAPSSPRPPRAMLASRLAARFVARTTGFAALNRALPAIAAPPGGSVFQILLFSERCQIMASQRSWRTEADAVSHVTVGAVGGV